jgi:hypothetical protein
MAAYFFNLIRVVTIRRFSHRRCATVFLILVGELFVPRRSLLRTRLRFRSSNKRLRAILRGAVDFKILRGEPARRFRIEFGMRGCGTVDDLRAKRAVILNQVKDLTQVR